MWQLVVLLLCFVHAPIKLICDSMKKIAPGSHLDLSSTEFEDYLRKQIIHFSSVSRTNDSTHHRNNPLISHASAASSKQLSHPSTPNRTPNQPTNTGAFPNDTERMDAAPRQTHTSHKPIAITPHFPCAQDYWTLHQPINESHSITEPHFKYHENDATRMEGTPFMYHLKDLDVITDRIILSLPPNKTKHDAVFLQGRARALISKNINFERFNNIARNKPSNLIIFSGEKCIVDPMTLTLSSGHDWNMIQNENVDRLRYLAMYYDHTISAFRHGIMELLAKIDEIGRDTQEHFEILFYCLPMQYQKCLSYAMMIQIYYEEVFGGRMDYMSFRVISTPQKSLTELQKINIYLRDLSDYRKIFVVDHRPFDLSLHDLYPHRSKMVRVPPFIVNVDPIKRRNWMNYTQEIRASTATGTVLFQMQSLLERYFKDARH